MKRSIEKDTGDFGPPLDLAVEALGGLIGYSLARCGTGKLFIGKPVGSRLYPWRQGPFAIW